MGRSSPVDAVKKVGKTAKDTTTFVVNPTGAATSTIADSITGADTGLAFNPVGEASGQGAEQFIDAPKKQKKAAEAAANRQLDAQRTAKRDLEVQEGEEAAQEKAVEKRSSARRRQLATKKKSGRSSTILTSALGGTSDASGTRKSLLGL